MSHNGHYVNGFILAKGALNFLSLSEKWGEKGYKRGIRHIYGTHFLASTSESAHPFSNPPLSFHESHEVNTLPISEEPSTMHWVRRKDQYRYRTSVPLFMSLLCMTGCISDAPNLELQRGDYGHPSPSTTAYGSDGSVTLDADTGTIPPPVRIDRGPPTQQNDPMDAEIVDAMGDGGQGSDALVDMGDGSYDAAPIADRGVGDTSIPPAEDAMLIPRDIGAPDIELMPDAANPLAMGGVSRDGVATNGRVMGNPSGGVRF